MGLGTYRTFDVAQNSADLPQLLEVLRLFHAHGGRLIDSSPMYGRAETVLGELSERAGLNRELFLATKVWTRGAAAGETQMRSSLAKLKRERLELMQIHNLVDWRTQARSLRRWKEQGRLRYIGITHYTVRAFDELRDVLKQERFDFVQLPYSVMTRQAEERLLPECQERGVAVLVNRPFEGGSLFSRVRGRPLPGFADELGARSYGQLFLKFLLAHPAVSCVIPATSRPQHLIDNMGAGVGALPDADLRERIAALVRES